MEAWAHLLQVDFIDCFFKELVIDCVTFAKLIVFSQAANLVVRLDRRLRVYSADDRSLLLRALEALEDLHQVDIID